MRTVGMNAGICLWPFLREVLIASEVRTCCSSCLETAAYLEQKRCIRCPGECRDHSGLYRLARWAALFGCPVDLASPLSILM